MVKRQWNMQERSRNNTLSRRYRDTIAKYGEKIYTGSLKSFPQSGVNYCDRINLNYNNNTRAEYFLSDNACYTL